MALTSDNAARDAAALDRQNAADAGALERTTLTQDRLDQRQDDAQAHENTVISADAWREADDTFWATQNALEEAVTPTNNVITMRNRAMEIADQLQKMPWGSGAWTPEKKNALMFELSEIDDQLFYEYKNKVYGEAEPPPAILRQLRESYPTFSDQPYRRWNETYQQYERRNSEDVETVESAIERAQRTIDRLNESAGINGGSWALDPAIQLRVKPYQRGGGVADDEIDPNSIQ